MDDAGGGKEEGDLDRDEAEGERKHAARSADVKGTWTYLFSV